MSEFQEDIELISIFTIKYSYVCDVILPYLLFIHHVSSVFQPSEGIYIVVLPNLRILNV